MINFKSSTSTLFLQIEEKNRTSEELLILEHDLMKWLETKHNDLFWEIEMHEGGRCSFMNDEIIFSGDNGLLILDKFEIDTL